METSKYIVFHSNYKKWIKDVKYLIKSEDKDCYYVGKDKIDKSLQNIEYEIGNVKYPYN